MREYISILVQALDDYRMAPEEFIDAGDDRVLVFSREGGRGAGKPHWQGGLSPDALEAVGLSK